MNIEQGKKKTLIDETRFDFFSLAADERVVENCDRLNLKLTYLVSVPACQHASMPGMRDSDGVSGSLSD